VGCYFLVPNCDEGSDADGFLCRFCFSPVGEHPKEYALVLLHTIHRKKPSRSLVRRNFKQPLIFMFTDFPYRTRRTVKPALMDSSREITRDLLLEILEDAHWAPTHGLTQPWRFHVFTGEARARLADALQTLYDQLTPVAEIRPEKRATLRENVNQAQAIVAVAAHLEAGGKVSRLDELCSTACAVQNLLLSAHQRGLGSFWATPVVACSQEFTAWLGLDSNHCSLGLVFLGYPKEGPTPRSIRVP
jgi:nitroreductase